jgi:hypothetical protein
MLHFLKSIPKKIFGKHKNKVSTVITDDEIDIAVEDHQPEVELMQTPSVLSTPTETASKAVSFSEEPPHPRRIKHTAFTRRPKTPPPTREQVTQADLTEQQDLKAMYSKVETQTTALQKEAGNTPLDTAKAATDAPVVISPVLSMKDEIKYKAKEHRHRTHTHNEYYKGNGRDTYNLQGRPLKSVFEDDNGQKLPVDERHTILRELQKGERKRHFK